MSRGGGSSLTYPEPVFVDLLRSPRIDSHPGEIDSSGSIPGLHKNLFTNTGSARYGGVGGGCQGTCCLRPGPPSFVLLLLAILLFSSPSFLQLSSTMIDKKIRCPSADQLVLTLLMLLLTEDDSPVEGMEGDKKVFYLFARADRSVITHDLCSETDLVTIFF